MEQLLEKISASDSSHGEKSETFLECPFCIEEYHEDQIFKCFHCNQFNCIDCHKKWLLQSPKQPHCLNPSCKAMIPLDTQIDTFGQKWVLGVYKEYKKDLLFNLEVNKIPITLNEIAREKYIRSLDDGLNKANHEFQLSLKPLQDQINKINEQINSLRRIHNEKMRPMRDELDSIRIKKTYQKFTYTYKCPSIECKGFLNSKFICELCDTNVCKHCYVKISEDQNHECNNDDVETFKQIKKEAKPCPKCGEFISKIGGCDQMFCNQCGTAFSWKTGQIETGLIHNPHAHAFFEQNAAAREMYLNNMNGQNNQGNECRAHIPPRSLLDSKMIDKTKQQTLFSMWRSITEFRHYARNRHLDTVEQNDENLDIFNDLRRKYVDGFYDVVSVDGKKKNKSEADKKFKIELHKRDKLKTWEKQNSNLILSTYAIAELYLWEIANLDKIIPEEKINPNKLKKNEVDLILKKNDEISQKNNLIDERANAIYNSLLDLIQISNDNFSSISEKFGYTKKKKIAASFYLS
jgi:hypothetical protein